MLEIRESRRDVFISHLDEFEKTGESDHDRDELLEILSSKCHIPVPDFRLSQLAADQLGEILSALDKLLFDEWITTPPSFSTLQHTQVLTTELCLLSLDKSEGLSLQSISNHVQSLVETISQSASNVFESLLLTQALYLNLMHFINEHDDSGTDAVHIAKQWAEDELSAENLFLVEFLGTLTLSLQNVVERASVFILKMEVECFKILLSTLTHLSGKDTHSECTENLLRLVQTNQWTSTETVTLLKALWEKYAEDVDAEEWVNFYKYFGITVDTNTNKTEDGDRKACYQKDVVYGTIETFAADHLRQTFEMKDVRPDRGYQCIIIDEVDSLLLDQGVQLTYLSSPMVSMQHLNIILAMIWSSVSQYGFLSTGHQTDGRAALVICETINKAKLIYEELKSSVPDGDIILYARSDNDSLSKIDKELCPGNIIIATNLAGRGTDIKVSKQVNNNGGLFVILSFLSENTRVELQAFGRTARKGKPGSAQVIVSTDHLQESLRTVPSLEAAKDRRDGLAVEKVEHMTKDIFEIKLREDLFAEYCKTLQDIYKNTDVDELRAIVAIMNEFWGIWLQTKSEEIDQLKINELQESLKADLSSAKIQSQSNNSPSSSIYHYIKFGNIAMGKKQWDISARLFEKAMNQDKSWAAIAFYSHAYCTIKLQEKDYLSKARDDLTKALESLKYLNSIILSHLEDKQQFYDLMQDEIRKSELQDIFKELGHTALQPFYADLSWQNRLNSSISSVMDRVEAEAKGKAQGILTLIEAAHMTALAAEAWNSKTAGTILDIRVLSETTGTKVVILEQNSHGKLTKMQELNPSTRAASQTVSLIYRPKSAQYPDGHYDVLINNQTVNVVSEGRSCLFHALARGMRPGASEEEITSAADHLRNEEADALLRHPGQWEPFIKRKEWTEAIRGGDWFMTEGAAPDVSDAVSMDVSRKF
ncbi:hypothetical protein AAFF_G00342010 [Aldrovandia affinis]|uniref:Protein translocase subunit SecA n=1 Tax=Aldrovandia affinis TaxID=143900 RepID=A0AAD7W095_9TELE|nr:hypothetical protein AAFF_G00342010 [Aldrovandia affinis]